MLLETHNEQVLLIMKQVYFMSSNNHDTFDLSPFLIYGCNKVSHVTHESANIDIYDSNNVKTPVALIRFFNITLVLRSFIFHITMT